MIDFKKKLQDQKDRKTKAQAEVELVVAGACQLMLNIADRAEPLQAALQTEMIACQCCGYTWSTTEPETIYKAWKQKGIPPGLGPLCDICWHLYSVTNQAHARRTSLKEVVRLFLEGRGKQTHRPMDVIWTEKR